MGAQVSNNPNITLNNPNEDIIEYEGYEEFAIVEIAKNDLLKQNKIKPNPSLNNHSGGSSIGKYESEHNLHKCKEKNREENRENNEDEKVKNESKFPHNNSHEQIIQNEEIKNENNQEENNNNNNDKLRAENNNNENIEKNEEDQKIENNNENNVEKKEEEKKIEEQVKNNNEIGENLKAGDDKDKDNDNDKMKLEENANNENNENINKDNIVANEEQNQNQIQKEEINNINSINNNNNDINNNINNNDIDNVKENNNNNEKNIEPNTKMDENKDNIKENNNVDVNEENTNEKNNVNNTNKNKNDDLAPRKIVLPNINTIISEKVLEEGAGNELLFMSNLNKMVHISIKERVKYSEKFCITTKDNFLIYETRENYIKVKKPLAIIPINTIKNVVLFKLTKKVINYDHFYIEFQLDENNRNNVYNLVDTFYINDLDNTNNENKNDTALVMFKTEEKNLAKKWYVLLKFLVELKLKN